MIPADSISDQSVLPATIKPCCPELAVETAALPKIEATQSTAQTGAIRIDAARAMLLLRTLSEKTIPKAGGTLRERKKSAVEFVLQWKVTHLFREIRNLCAGMLKVGGGGGLALAESEYGGESVPTAGAKGVCQGEFTR